MTWRAVSERPWFAAKVQQVVKAADDRDDRRLDKYTAYVNRFDEAKARGRLRTSARPTFNILLLLRASVWAFILKVPSQSCSDLGLNAGSQWPSCIRPGGY